MRSARSTKAFARAVAPSGQPAETVVLRLYIAGSSERSTRAVQNARQICDAHLAGKYELEIIDIFLKPALAREDQILAVPTMIRKLPSPVRRFIGDLSARDAVLAGLDIIKPKQTP